MSAKIRYILYTQLERGLVYKLDLKPIDSEQRAKDAVQAARLAVARSGEEVFADCRKRVNRDPDIPSLGTTSVWYERKR